jgi:hypothetical protein
MKSRWLAVVVAACAATLTVALYLEVDGGGWPVRLSLVGVVILLAVLAVWVVGTGRIWRK